MPSICAIVAAGFLRDVLGGDEADGYVEIRALPVNGRRNQWWFSLPNAIDEAAAFAMDVQDQPEYEDAGVYFGAAPRVREGGKAEDVARVYALRADCDDDAAIDRLAEHIAAGLIPRPTWRVDSGGLTAQQRPRTHSYWTLDQWADPEVARQAMLRLAAAIGSDRSTADPPRVMRAPGSRHVKSGGRLARIVGGEMTTRYSLDEIVGRLPALDGRLGSGQARTGDVVTSGRPDLLTLLAPQLEKMGARIGRNSGTFDFLCQARDHGYTADELLAEGPRLVAGINQLAPPSKDGDSYELSEFQKSVRSVYTQAPRMQALSDETWPELDHRALPAFPVEALPAPAARFALAAARQTQVPVDLAAFNVLGVLSAAVRGAAQLECSWGVEELVLYLIVPLPSGERKSAVLSAVKRPLKKLERELKDKAQTRIARQKAKRRALQNELAGLEKQLGVGDPDEDVESRYVAIETQLEEIGEPVEPQFLADDATPEALVDLLAKHGSIAVLAAESALLDNVLGAYGQRKPNLHAVCQAYGGESTNANRRQDGFRDLERPLATILLSPQPHVLEALVRNDVANQQGLVGRFGIGLPESTQGHREVGTERIPDDIVRAWETIVRHVAALGGSGGADNADSDRRSAGFQRGSVGIVGDSQPVVLRLSPEAQLLLDELQRDLEPRLGDGGDLRPFSAWVNRHWGRIARIAALIHLCEYEPEEDIDAETMRAAMRIGEYLLAHMLVALSTPSEKVRKTIGWLERQGKATVTRRDLHRGPLGGRGAADEADDLAAQLVKSGVLREIDSAHSTRREYAVNPNLLGVR